MKKKLTIHRELHFIGGGGVTVDLLIKDENGTVARCPFGVTSGKTGERVPFSEYDFWVDFEPSVADA